MAYKFVQLYDKNNVPTFPIKGPTCHGIFDQEDSAAYWYKFADFTMTGDHTDITVAFQVTKTYNTWAYGTLVLHVRRDTSTTISSVTLEWTSLSQNIRPKHYAYVTTANKISLYFQRTYRWEDYHFEIIKGDTRGGSNYGTAAGLVMYNYAHSAGTTALPSGLTSGYSYYAFYKVGDIICTTNSTDPSTYYGGTWAKIQDRFLIGAGNSYGATGTGGSTTSKIETGHMPSHSHTMPSHNHWLEFSSGNGGDHTHGVQSHNGNTGSWEYLRPSGWTGGNGWRQVDGVGAHSHWVAGWTGGNNGAGSTNATGGSTALPIMPPWYGVYFWRRTA